MIVLKQLAHNLQQPEYRLRALLRQQQHIAKHKGRWQWKENSAEFRRVMRYLTRLLSPSTEKH